ncbi:MAG TPA: hypothetical protein VME24_07950 [Alphaproteobacteria bacterium]|nr:hypothetical protein [Alphaproteobacteria bacterium]
MAEQLDLFGATSPPNIVETNHEVLAIEPHLLPAVNDLSLSEHRNKCELQPCFGCPHD